jgi:hypothetical protein
VNENGLPPFPLEPHREAENRDMTAKKVLLGSALLLGATLGATLGTTSATMAQGYDNDSPYGYSEGYSDGPVFGVGPQYGYGVYDYAPGYDGYDRPRGGPGPRVGNGTGAGIGAVR